jgi:hypothetical protein
MELKDFVAEQKGMVDDFAAYYERQRKRKSLTMFRPLDQWNILFREYMENYDGRSSTASVEESEDKGNQQAA